jgi:hypothetical protein
MEWTGLQLEMVVAYYGELWSLLALHTADESGADWQQRCKDLVGCQTAFADASVATTNRLAAFGDALRQLAGNAETLRRAMLTIQMTHISGLIETQRVQDDGCAAIFAEIRQQTDGIKHDLDIFSDLLKGLSTVAQQAPDMMRVYGEAVALLNKASARLYRMAPTDASDDLGTLKLPAAVAAAVPQFMADDTADDGAHVHGAAAGSALDSPW